MTYAKRGKFLELYKDNEPARIGAISPGDPGIFQPESRVHNLPGMGEIILVSE